MPIYRLTETLDLDLYVKADSEADAVRCFCSEVARQAVDSSFPTVHGVVTIDNLRPGANDDMPPGDILSAPVYEYREESDEVDLDDSDYDEALPSEQDTVRSLAEHLGILN